MGVALRYLRAGRCRMTNERLDEVLQVLRERKLRIDPRLSGECERWFENPGIRRWYYSPDGMTIDECAEAIGELTGAYGSDRMTERETCDLLERLFVDGSCRTGRNTDSSRSAMLEAEHAVQVRQKTRLRLYECACGQKVRVASDHFIAEHVHVDPDTLTESRMPFVLRTPVLQSVTPF
jgi:hypothetical protein